MRRSARGCSCMPASYSACCRRGRTETRSPSRSRAGYPRSSSTRWPPSSLGTRTQRAACHWRRTAYASACSRQRCLLGTATPTRSTRRASSFAAGMTSCTASASAGGSGPRSPGSSRCCRPRRSAARPCSSSGCSGRGRRTSSSRASRSTSRASYAGGSSRSARRPRLLARSARLLASRDQLPTARARPQAHRRRGRPPTAVATAAPSSRRTGRGQTRSSR
mmetsp:Transcript_87772/g.226211  ORF Transcript_87772/g.226211 Transcript_87772/m.226211 type:complete len:221 (+) Transcript_87772:715-1377(+)